MLDLYKSILMLNMLWVVTMEPGGDSVRGRKDPQTCCEKLENSSFSTKCQDTILWAEKRENYAYTPNFPHQFPIQKKCVWVIYATPGKRVRLEFQDFYLIGPGDDGMCHSQGVLIKSPLSGRHMGPHCGNAGLPTAVSAGNHLVVELISNIPMTTENFRGFKMSYAETVETPSPQLKPPNWRNDIELTANPALIANLFPTPTRTSRRVTRTTSKSSRFKPSKLPPFRSLPRTIIHVTQTSNSFMTRKSEKDGLKLEDIVGIAVGGIVCAGIITLLTIKFFQRRNNTKNEDKGDGAAVDSASIAVKKDDVSRSSFFSPLPGYYVCYYYQNQQGSTITDKQQPRNSPRIKKSPTKFKRADENGNKTATTEPQTRRKRRSSLHDSTFDRTSKVPSTDADKPSTKHYHLHRKFLARTGAVPTTKKIVKVRSGKRGFRSPARAKNGKRNCANDSRHGGVKTVRKKVPADNCINYSTKIHKLKRDIRQQSRPDERHNLS